MLFTKRKAQSILFLSIATGIKVCGVSKLGRKQKRHLLPVMAEFRYSMQCDFAPILYSLPFEGIQLIKRQPLSKQPWFTTNTFTIYRAELINLTNTNMPKLRITVKLKINLFCNEQNNCTDRKLWGERFVHNAWNLTHSLGKI